MGVLPKILWCLYITQHINTVIFASKEYGAQIRCQLVGVIDTNLASIETNLPIVTNHPKNFACTWRIIPFSLWFVVLVIVFVPKTWNLWDPFQMAELYGWNKWLLHPRKINIEPENTPLEFRKIIFQTTIFSFFGDGPNYLRYLGSDPPSTTSSDKKKRPRKLSSLLVGIPIPKSSDILGGENLASVRYLLTVADFFQRKKLRVYIHVYIYIIHIILRFSAIWTYMIYPPGN